MTKTLAEQLAGKLAECWGDVRREDRRRRSAQIARNQVIHQGLIVEAMQKRRRSKPEGKR